MNFLKNAASHSSWSVQGLYIRIQQHDAVSNIKNSYRNSHLKLAFPFRVELLGKYGQSDHFNNQDTGWPKQNLDDELRFRTTRKGGGANCYHSYHSIGFRDTNGGIQSCWEMTKAEITQSHWTGKEKKKARSECEHWEGKEKRNGETKIKSDMTRKNGTQKSKKRARERENGRREKAKRGSGKWVVHTWLLL